MGFSLTKTIHFGDPPIYGNPQRKEDLIILMEVSSATKPCAPGQAPKVNFVCLAAGRGRALEVCRDGGMVWMVIAYLGYEWLRYVI